jgi:hypothetical protein
LCYSRFLNLEIIKQFAEYPIVKASSLTPPVQPFVQKFYDLAEKYLQALEVSDHTEVIVVAAELGIQHFEYFSKPFVPKLLNPLREL